VELGCYSLALFFIESPKRLFDWSCFWIHIECMLRKFPGSSWHVSGTPDEDFMRTSVLFYADVRFMVMEVVFSGSVGWIRTFFVSRVESKA
jgi:hypothetical protein